MLGSQWTIRIYLIVTKWSGDNFNSRWNLPISLLGIYLCVLNLGACIKEDVFLSPFRKEIKICCVDEICSNICSQGYIHSYEIALVHLISVLLGGQTIEISLPLGPQCSIFVLHLM